VVLIYSVTGVLVLERFGVPLSSLIAPATVAGVALGFGAQRIVQDILAGFFMITERQYGFGDLIRISSLGSTTGVTGTVEDVTLRTTRMRTVNGEVVIIPNGQINQVTNLSRDWARAVIDVPIPATADITRVNAILQTVGEELYADEKFRPLLLDTPTVMGVESIDVDRFSIRMVCRTLPGKQFDIGRELRARIATALRHEGIILALDVETSSAPPDAH
jgi:small conductance mechanosensitive channel